MSNPADPVAVVCHDAGGANLLVHHLKHGAVTGARFCALGPAAMIVEHLFPDFRNRDLRDALLGARTLLSGTSWGSDLEREARVIARSAGITSISVLDHWVNYRERFELDGTLTLPDELWVYDAPAEREARRCFPETKITRQCNYYMDSQVEEITRLASAPPSDRYERVLYVLEPARSDWDGSGIAGEFQALHFFFDNLELVGGSYPKSVRLRPHPSNEPGKYDSWLRRDASVVVEIDESSSLAQSIAWSECVVGCETYALVVALNANRKVLSSLPPQAPPLRLPFPEIIQLRDLQRQ